MVPIKTQSRVSTSNDTENWHLSLFLSSNLLVSYPKFVDI